MLEPGMEAQCRWRRKFDAARLEIGLCQGAVRCGCALPNGKCRLIAFSLLAIRPSNGSCASNSSCARKILRELALPVLVPEPAQAEGRDHPTLFAARMAADQHLAIGSLTDRQARLAIGVGRAARH